MNTTPPVVSEVALVAVDADTATATSPFRAAGVKRPRVEDAQLLGVDIDSRDVVILEEEEEEEVPEWAQALTLAQEKTAQWFAYMTRQMERDERRHARLMRWAEKKLTTTMTVGFSNLGARISNGLADTDDFLRPLLTRDGLAVPNFPRTPAHIAELPGPQLATLLQAYGQEVPQGLRERRRAFARYVGARIN